MDESSLFLSLKRYAQVGGQVSGLAARLAGQHYFGKKVDEESYAAHLKEALGGLKGPLMKIAQFLATVPDALPAAYAEELLSLQSQAPAMGVPFVRRRMSAELGPHWLEKFKSFELEATAAASLGQVHRAIHINGDKLACKLQYANMEALVKADLDQLKLILSLYKRWRQSIDTDDVFDEIKDRLTEELDYQREQDHLAQFQKIFAQTPTIRLPQVYPELSTHRLLTMSFLEGDSIFSKINAPQEERETLAELIFTSWYKPLYHHGIIHADAHPGNYLIAPDGALCLLDFGCVRTFEPHFIKAVIDLYHGLLENNQEQIVAAYTAWGFNNLTKEMIDIITQWAKLLYEPLLDDRVRPLQEGFNGTKGFETAAKVHEELHRLGGIRPPRAFVFMDRVAVGIGSILIRLRVEKNWHQLYETLIHTSPFISHSRSS